MTEKKRWAFFSLFTAVIFLFLFGSGCFWQNKRLLEKENQILKTAGVLETENTQGALYDLFQGKGEEPLISRGKEALERYGYKTIVRENLDAEMRQYMYETVFLLSAAYAAVTAAAFLWMKKTAKHREQEFDEIRGMAEQFYAGNYEISYEESEGTKSQLLSRLDSLGRKLQVNENKLIEEKEGTKSLVTDISHQLKTPVASLEMCLELMEGEDLTKEEQKEFLQQAIGQTKRLDSLTKALINISRMETGMISIKKEEAPIMDTIAQAVSTVYVKAQEKQIRIEVIKESSSIERLKISHDPKWTREAIANILENAVKYSDEGTVVRIRMMMRTSFLRIEIEDQGIGIHRENQSKIFQRFYRGNEERVKEAEGSGVGLYLTRKILEAQGGTVSVSDGKQGSIFILHLSLTDL
ncbi:sensor histidine kinase [Anaerostipes sp.]|uniref:sensor histidine kinase n=1 Tax=Anaerostipes sp. TaxID=1872530 RepID=UPI0025C470BB|nr:HAMP domain-containing sensor histidine kinase [Anaerostipes sp.]MBS7008699.1 sensor histidine kinase [Anaerostipes sp.]